MFAEHPVPAKGGKKATATKKMEPPKPTAPVLGPPRLVKTIRPATPVEDTHAADAAVDEAFPTVPVTPTPVAADSASEIEEPPVIIELAEPEPMMVSVEVPELIEIEEAPPAPAAPPVAEEEPMAAAAETPDVTTPRAAAPPPQAVPPSGRFVPPTLRLRVEQPGQTPLPARPLTPAKRPPVTQPRILQQPAATPPAGARPGTPP